MKHLNHFQSMSQQDRLGRELASRLAESVQTLPHDVSERLRVARQVALSKHSRAMPASSMVHNGNGSLALQGDFWLWRFAASFTPLMMLIAGLIALNLLFNDDRASELADLDTAILTDDLPPAAYADPGFAQFLKASLLENKSKD